MKTKIKHNRPSRSEAERSSALMRPKGATFLKVFLGTALLAFLLIAVYFANAATTVGTNFSTDGNLTVNGNAALGDTTSDTTTVQGQTTITTLAAGLLNVLTGNLKVGNGTPGVTQDGEDGYIEGTFEVDGASQFDGAVTTNSTLTAASTAAFNGNVTIGNEATDTITIQTGSVSAPAVTFSGDSNTGIYTTGADNLSIAVGGTQRFSVSEGTQAVTITGTTTISNTVAIGGGSTISKIVKGSLSDDTSGWVPDSATTSFTITADAASVLTTSVISVSVEAQTTQTVCMVIDATAATSFVVKCVSGAPANGTVLNYMIVN